MSTSREGIFNYTVRTDAYSVEKLVESFDLNCTMAGIDLATGKLFQSDEFNQFLVTKEIKVIRYHSPERTLARMVRKATEFGVYYDKGQELALRLIFQTQPDGSKGKYGQLVNYINLPDLKLVKINTLRIEDYVEFACKWFKASKTQKRNVMAFTEGHGVGSHMVEFINLLLTERNMLPADQLAAARRAMFKEGHERDVMYSIMRMKSNEFNFQAWWKMIAFCKKTKHQMAWGFLVECRNLQELRNMIAKKIRNGRARWKSMILPNAVTRYGYTIKEITKERDLIAEGGEMGHCVGGYAHWCVSGQQAIVAVKAPKGKRYTLAFDKTRVTDEHGKDQVKYRLSQFKGKFNSKPEDLDYHLVLRIIRTTSTSVEIRKNTKNEYFRW